MPGKNRGQGLGKAFGTGYIAKALGVAPRTVSKWFDAGLLKGYRIPSVRDARSIKQRPLNQGDRRVPLAEIVRFARTYGFPEEVLTRFGLVRRVVACTQDTVLLEPLRRRLSDEVLLVVESWYDIGQMAHTMMGVLILDCALLGRSSVVQHLAHVQGDEVSVVVLASEDERCPADFPGATVVFRPFDPERAARIVDEVASSLALVVRGKHAAEGGHSKFCQEGE